MTWQTESLGNLLAPAGNTRAGEQDLPVLSITMHDGLVDQSTKFKKRVASLDISSYRVVYTNELVVGFPIDEGVLGFQTKYQAAVVSPAYGIWKLRRPAETHIPFMEAYLRSSEARKIYAQKMRGAVARRRSLKREDFLEIEIPFPPLDEQKRIAEVLDKVEALRHQRRQSIQLSEKLLRSVFLDVFGDPLKNPKGFKVRKLGDFFVSPKEGAKCGPFGSSLKKSDFQASGVPVWGIDNISPDGRFISIPFKRISHEKFVELNGYSVTAGDIIISRAGTVGRMCVVEGAEIVGVIGTNLIRLRLNAEMLSPHYFVSLMRYCKDSVGRLRAGSDGTFSHMGTGVLQNLEFPYPTTAAQEQYLRIMDALRLTSAPSDLSEREFVRLFSSIQQRAFRGELDLSRLALDSSSDARPAPEPESPATKVAKLESTALFLGVPEAVEAALKTLDDTVSEGGSISWSADYFKYRILGTQSAPFSFGEVMRKAESVFNDPPYEEIKDIILEFLGYGGGRPLLSQHFDLHINEETEEVSGRREIVFGPAL